MKTRILALWLVFVMAISLVGCGSSSQNKTSAVSTNNTAVTEAKTGATRTITDTAGRTLTLPTDIKKVYSLSPIGNIIMYTLAPDKIAGLSAKLSEEEKKYLLESYQKLPVLSGNYGNGNTMNTEEILKVKPDIIVNMGNVDHTSVESSQKIQEQLNIPVVIIGFDLKTLGKAYEFLGDLVDEKTKAKELGDYCQKTVNDIQEISKTIPQDKRVKVYYAEGPKGLQTDPKGSPHSEVLEVVGGVNIADVAVQAGFGRTPVSMEQLLKWDPDTIIVGIDAGTSEENNPYKLIQSNSDWGNLKAVKNKKVYAIPYFPFNWFDRPPSVNRIIGVKWLANLLYPDYFKFDMKQETKDFYDKFYHHKLTDPEADEILANAV